MGKPAVVVDNVSMKFNLSKEKVDNLKDYLIKFIKKEIKYNEFWALQNVNFEVQKGDRVGILGLNGAGKSTLLKVIAGVFKPTEGKVIKNGRLVPLLELGAGFDPQYTGRENIYLYGAMLGYSKSFIEEKFDEIVEFSELKEFIDVPIKNYSSGMKARLGFSIATLVSPDILILDEVLSVGDAKFRKKSEKKVLSMFDKGVTVLFVSHSLQQVQRLCNKAMILEKGKLIAYGDIDEINRNRKTSGRCPKNGDSQTICGNNANVWLLCYYTMEEQGSKKMTLQQILEEVKNGQLSVEHAENLLKKEGYEDMDYAKLDTTRKERTGFAEVVYCARKADEHLLNIYQKLYEEDGEVFGTRASRHQYELVKSILPQVVYDPVSGILKIEKEKEHIGKIAVCTAGTADISVAEEAAQTAEYFGTHVERIYDVGVSGMHRLFSRLDTIQEANCVVAVAGMEGALASVMGGLVKRPVIAVPTSVGYGASFHGLSALLTMINSCANGIAVVNIDNGFGAGYLATQINRLAEGK